MYPEIEVYNYLKNGKKILIGTDKEKELSEFLTKLFGQNVR